MPWKGLGGTDWGRRLTRFGLEAEAGGVATPTLKAGGVATLKVSAPSKLRSAGMGLLWGAELLAVMLVVERWRAGSHRGGFGASATMKDC